MKKVLTVIFFVVFVCGSWPSHAAEPLRCAFDGYHIWNDHDVTEDYQGKTYHFCTKFCRQLFLQNPSKYLVGSSGQINSVNQSNQHRDALVRQELDRLELHQHSSAPAHAINADVGSSMKSEIQQNSSDHHFANDPEDFPREIVLTSADGTSQQRMKPITVDVGVEYQKYSYKEPSLGVVDEGVHGAVEGVITFRNMVRGERQPDGTAVSRMNAFSSLGARFFDGSVDYEGSGTFDNIRDHGYELRLLAGIEMLYKNFLLSPYTGLALRKLYNEFAEAPAKVINGTAYASGYDRDSKYYYWPLGMTVTRHLGSKWSLSMNAEYDHLMNGTQISHLDQSINIAGANAGYLRAKNKQDKGYGLRLSMRLARNCGLYDVYLEPFYRYWNIEDSNLALIYDLGGGFGLAGMEPANKTTEMGIRMGVVF